MTDDFKIKLINPIDIAMTSAVVVSYGIAVLAAALKENSYQVDVFDYNEISKRFLRDPAAINRSWLNYTNRKFRDIKTLDSYLVDGKYDKKLDVLSSRLVSLTDFSSCDLIGFSVVPKTSLYSALLVAKKLKENYPDKKIVFGRPWTSYYWENFYPGASYIDYVIVGPGEKSLVELIKHIKGEIAVSEVSGLIYMDGDGNLQKNPRNVFNAEEESSPDYSVFNIDRYRMKSGKAVLYYRTSSGCVNHCSYCEDVGRLQIKSPEKVIKELKELKVLYKNICIEYADQMLNYSINHFRRLCSMMESEKIIIDYMAYALISKMSEEFIDLFRRSGCICLKYGMESADPDRLKEIGKGHTVEQAEKIFACTAAAGIKVHTYFIVGFPHESSDEIDKILRFIERNSSNIFSVIVSIFGLKATTDMFSNPSKYRIDNIRIASPEELIYNTYIYDEAGALKWKEKKKQAQKHHLMVDKAIYYNITAKRYKKLVPYWLMLKIYVWSKSNRLYCMLISVLRKFFLKGQNTELGNLHDQRLEEKPDKP